MHLFRAEKSIKQLMTPTSDVSGSLKHTSCVEAHNLNFVILGFAELLERSQP